MTAEREIKTEVPETFVLPNLDGVAGLAAADRGVRLLDATYWDTDTLRLVRSGYGLRYRTTDGGAGTWTLKSGTHRVGPAMVRDELEIPGSPDELPTEVAARVAAAAPPEALHPVARLRTARRIVDLSDGGRPWAEVADDTVRVLDGAREALVFREVEVELQGDADEGKVEPVVDALRAAGAGPPAATSKYARALRALGYEIESTTVD